jgi:hypothetical protein
MFSVRGCSLAAAIAAAACVDKAPPSDPHKVDAAFVQSNLLAVVPSIPHRVDARFESAGGGEVVYLGNDVTAGELVPGDTIEITHFWRVVTPPGPGWNVFAHLRGDAGDFLNLDASEMRFGHPSATWRAGEIIRDPQSVVVPRDWKSKHATLRIGLFPAGAHRIADRMEARAAGDVADRAVAAATWSVDLSKAPPPPGTLTLKKAGGPIVIDGKADDAGWRNAAVQTAFTTAEGCPALADATEAKLTWDDQFLYVFVSAEDADVWSPFVKHDDHLWENDVVEVFVDADGNKRGYVELQVNPRNVTFDTWFAVGRPNRDDTFDSGMQTAVVVRGTLDDRDDGDSGWDVEIAIPMAAVKGKDAAMKVNVPPRLGDVWHLNVVRGEAPETGGKTAASWNRITCEDFHGLDRMLSVQFADVAGNVKEGAAPVVPITVPTPSTPRTPVPRAPGAPAR